MHFLLKFVIIWLAAFVLLAAAGCSTCTHRNYLGMTREQAAEAVAAQKRKTAGPMKGAALMTVYSDQTGQFIWQFPRTKEQVLFLGGNASEWGLGFHKDSRFFGSFHFYRIRFERDVVTEQKNQYMPWWWFSED